MIVKSAKKPVLDDVVMMAKEHQSRKGLIAEEYYRSIYSINKHQSELLFSRLAEKLSKAKWSKKLAISNLNKLISQIEMLSSIRTYIEKNEKKIGINLDNFLNVLSFSFLATTLLLSAHVQVPVFCSSPALF